MGWPTRKEEEWMRTDIRGFNLKKFDPPKLDEVVDAASLPSGVLAEGVDIVGKLFPSMDAPVVARCPKN